jgi:hypothetical protein
VFSLLQGHHPSPNSTLPFIYFFSRLKPVRGCGSLLFVFFANHNLFFFFVSFLLWRLSVLFKKDLPIMSDTEKVPVADTISNSEGDQVVIDQGQIVDPDAGLSDEERAANVSCFCY